MKRRCGILLFALSVLAGLSYAQTTDSNSLGRVLYVDDDAPADPGPGDVNVSDPNEDGSKAHPFDSIQEAIDAARDSLYRTADYAGGDTIVVAPGHYLSPDPWVYDEINLKGKPIRLISSAPTDFSVIEKTVLCGVVIFQGDEGTECLLQGFKVQNHGHGGILGNNTLATISHCIISGNGPCSATVIKDCRGLITNCLIADNTTFHDCGVLPVVSGCVQLVNCTIANNASGVGMDFSTWPYDPMIRNCILYGNQGAQTIDVPTPSLRPRSHWQISHCLIENCSELGLDPLTPILDTDPCFVRAGVWIAGQTASPTASTLIEGDYHLMSEGWRWSDHELHGSHWYFDSATSPAIDAGDLMEPLGEELERIPDDPEGCWGVNRAIDIGAYGGTTQASLAPNRGSAPGAGTVDLRDYWPLAKDNEWWTNVHGPTWRCVHVSDRMDSNGVEVFKMMVGEGASNSGPSYRYGYWVFANDASYATTDVNALDSLPQVSELLQMRYPQYLTVGAAVQTPEDPFAAGTPASRSAVIVRDTLDAALAGTAFDASMFVPRPAPGVSLSSSWWEYGQGRPWPDVIAFRVQNADGTLGEPITIFARGFGPLMLNGQPVDQAHVGGITFSLGGGVRRR